MSDSNNAVKCKCLNSHCSGDFVYCDLGCYKIFDSSREKIISAGCHLGTPCVNDPGFCHFTAVKGNYCCCKEPLCNEKNGSKTVFVNITETDGISSFQSGSKTHIYIWPILIGITLSLLIMVMLLKKRVRHWHRFKKNSINDLVLNSEASIEMTPRRFTINEGVPDISRHCKIIEQLGHGRYGKIWLGKLEQNGSTSNVAIKIFKESDKTSWENELAIYKYDFMKYPDILKYIGFDTVDTKDELINFASGSFSQSEEINFKNYWIVTEYQSNGSCYDFLKNNTLSIEQMLNLCLSITRGVSYLHSEADENSFAKPLVVHRDLKSSNILIKDDGHSACIADFGLAVIFETGVSIGDSHFQVGTRRYMAPEVVDGAIQFSRESFMRIDVYALALILWEILWRTRCPSNSDHVPIPDHELPFQSELGENPSLEALHTLILINRVRPPPQPWWFTDEGSEEDIDHSEKKETEPSAQKKDEDSKVGKLREVAALRKSRLLKLREQAQNLDRNTPKEYLDEEGEEAIGKENTILSICKEKLPEPVFRNYKPLSSVLMDGELENPSMVDVRSEISDYVRAGKNESTVEDINLMNLAPRKPDWDLKRSVEKKLKKLEKRTQRAIAEIVRERWLVNKDLGANAPAFEA